MGSKFIFNNLILKNKYINNDNKNLCVIHGDTKYTFRITLGVNEIV